MTGGAATISEKILNSKQMKAAKEALTQDQETTLELQTQIKALSKNEKLLKTLAVSCAKSGGSISGKVCHCFRVMTIFYKFSSYLHFWDFRISHFVYLEIQALLLVEKTIRMINF